MHTFNLYLKTKSYVLVLTFNDLNIILLLVHPTCNIHKILILSCPPSLKRSVFYHLFSILQFLRKKKCLRHDIIENFDGFVGFMCRYIKLLLNYNCFLKLTDSVIFLKCPGGHFEHGTHFFLMLFHLSDAEHLVSVNEE